MEGLALVIGAGGIGRQIAEDQLDNLFENFPLVKDHLEYVLNGGQSQDFMQAYDPNLDYHRINISNYFLKLLNFFLNFTLNLNFFLGGFKIFLKASRASENLNLTLYFSWYSMLDAGLLGISSQKKHIIHFMPAFLNSNI